MLKPSIYVSDDIRHTALNSRVSEDDGTHLSRPDLDVEVVPLVGDLEYFGPGEAIDAQFISVDEQAAGTNPQHDLHSLRILTETQTDASLEPLYTHHEITAAFTAGLFQHSNLQKQHYYYTTNIYWQKKFNIEFK